MKILVFIYNYYIYHINNIHDGLLMPKLKSSAVIGFTLTPLAVLIDFLAKWTIDNQLYLGVISVALISDLLIGIIVHFFYFKDFSIRKMTVKFLEKLFCTYIGLMLFELFGILFLQYHVEMGSYLKLSIALTVLSYPVLSAFGNLTVITKGKFPPTSWIEKLTNFNKTGNIKDIIDQEKKEE